MTTSGCLSEKELISRVQMMRAGERTIYFRGCLTTAAFFRPDVARLRDTAQRLSNMVMQKHTGELHVGMGLITLTQLRVGNGDYAYHATKLR